MRAPVSPWVVGLLGIAITLGGVPLVFFLAHMVQFSLGDCRAAVLMYHGVVARPSQAGRYQISEAAFAQQMDELRAAGAQTRSPAALLDTLAGRRGRACPFLPREVVITFDLDGRSEHVERALPHLLRTGFKAVFFVPTGFIDHGSAVSREDLRRLAQAGMTIGSHSEWHYDMRSERPPQMLESLRRTRVVLHGITGQPIEAFAAPGGRYDDAALEAARGAGFRAFFTSDPCYLRRESSAFGLCRIEIRGDKGLTAVQALTHPSRLAGPATLWWLKRSAEKVVGRTRWNRLSRTRPYL